MQIENNCKTIGSEFSDWISQNIIEEPFEEVGNPIRKFIPPVFEAYCKILHPFIVDLNANDAKYNEKEEERKEEAALIKRMYHKLNFDDTGLLTLDIKTFIETGMKIVLDRHKKDASILQLPLVSIPDGQLKEDIKVLVKEPLTDAFGKLGNLFQAASQGQKLGINPIHDREFENVGKKLKVKWEDIARKYGLQFHHDISPISYSKKFEMLGFPLNLYFPNYSLDSEDCNKILNALKEFSKTQKVLIHSFSDNYDLTTKLCPIEKMIKDNKDDALNGGYIIDENKEWAIYSDYFRDLQMTIIGGSKQLINALKEQTDLEIVECSEFSRVDHYSDTLN
jgi:hypothetical protein